MYKRFLFSLLALLIFSFIGCSNTKQYYITPPYSQQKVDASVLILPLESSWFDGTPSHTFGSLSGPAKTAFYQSFQPLLSKNLNSETTMIDSEQSFNGDMFKTSKLKFGNDSLNVLVPNGQSKISVDEEEPEIILLLDQYYFRKKKKTTGASSYAGHEKGVTRTHLYFETKYIYWDTDQQKVIAWGTTDSSTILDKSSTISSSEYYKVLSEAVEKMAKRGPVL